jgi:hypothetical protein
MCVVSMIMDHYGDKWRRRAWPELVPEFPYTPTVPLPSPDEQRRALEQFLQPVRPAITAQEIQEFRELLERAREYDRRNNEPECEMAEKREAILKIAKQLGVEISFL